MAPIDPSFEDFFDLVPTGAVFYAPVLDEQDELVDFRFVRLNPAGQRLLSLPAQPSSTFRTYFPQSVAAGVFAWHRAAYLTGRAEPFDFPYAGDGFDTYFRLVGRRSGDLLLVNFTDMADLPRTGAEQALRESLVAEQQARAEAAQQRQRFREVLTQMPAYIAVYQGPDHIYQFVNPAYQSLFPHRSFLGLPFREGTPEAVALGVVALFDQVYQTGEPIYLREMEGWFDFDGTGQPVQVFLNISLHPLRNVQGGIDGVMDFTYDVSQQVRARQQVDQLNQELEHRVQARTAQLAEQQDLLAQILRQVPAAIATLSGPGHRFSFANARYQDLVGHRVTVGQSVAEALPEVVEQGVLELLDRVYRMGEPFLGREIMIMLERPPGSPHHYHYDLTYLPLRDGHSQVQGILVFAVEVSEQVKARRQVQRLNQELAASNAELNRSNARLLRTNADLDTFVYTASHDLKAPITNIEGLLLALREGLPADVGQQEVIAQLLAMLDDTVTRFRFTITQLTDLVRLQQSQDGPAEPVAFRPLISAVCQDLAPEIQAAQATVHVEVVADAWVSFAPANLRSIVYNLLSNAVKYRDPARPAQVWVRVAQQPDAVTLYVRDNGLGLDETQQGRLFGVFQRLHTHVEGTGVGLYMIKRLIENAGGDIAVSSALGVGTTFTVTLPAS